MAAASGDGIMLFSLEANQVALAIVVSIAISFTKNTWMGDIAMIGTIAVKSWFFCRDWSGCCRLASYDLNWRGSRTISDIFGKDAEVRHWEQNKGRNKVSTCLIGQNKSDHDIQGFTYGAIFANHHCSLALLRMEHLSEST